MGDRTGIEWTGSTWNLTRGCSRTTPDAELEDDLELADEADGPTQSGCGDGTGGGCYAERMAGRFCGPGQPYEGLVRITAKGPRWTGVVRPVPEHLFDPIRWKRPRKIFPNSMSDLFHESLPDEVIDQALAVMLLTPRHTYQVLTKRAKRMRRYFSDPALYERVLRAAGPIRQRYPELNLIAIDNPATCPKPWIWLCVSVENQRAADARIPELLATPAAVRGLSVEPLLGPVDLHAIQIPGASRGLRFSALQRQHDDRFGQSDTTIDWVIAGCESGPKSRPADVLWFRMLRDQCATAGVPFFLKQAKEDVEICEQADGCREPVRYFVFSETDAVASCGCTTEGPESCSPVGIQVGEGSKRKQGGVIGAPYLDGVQHLEFPERAATAS